MPTADVVLHGGYKKHVTWSGGWVPSAFTSPSILFKKVQNKFVFNMLFQFRGARGGHTVTDPSARKNPIVQALFRERLK